MAIFEINKWVGGISDFSDRGIAGAFKFGSSLDIHKLEDSLSAGQAMVEEGLNENSPSASPSPSASVSPSATPSTTPSASSSATPSSSVSKSPSASTGVSSSPSASPSLSPSPSSSVSPSATTSASPSASAGLTTVYDDLVKFFVKATDGQTYEFGNTGSIYKRTSDGHVSKVYDDANGEIKGAVEKPSDSNKTYLVWATDHIVMKKELPGRSDWNDVTVVQSNLNSGYPHTMIQIHGSALICNGPWLALIGYDDSYTNEALDLIPGNIAKTLVERNGRVIIGTYRISDPNKGINAAIDSEVPLAQVGDEGQLYFANMSDSVPVKQFPGGGKVNPDGVCNQIEQANFFDWEENSLSWVDKQSVGNMSLWGVYSATSGKNGVYSYGRKNKNHSFSLNLDYPMDVDEIGAVTSVDGTVLASYRDGVDFGVRASDSTTKAQGIYEGLELKVDKAKNVTDITEWKKVEIYCEALPDGSSIEFQYQTDKSGGWSVAKMENGSTQFRAKNEKKAVFFIASSGDMFEPRIILNPVGNESPVVHRARIYVE